jgi:hypothetical protein
MNTGKVLALAAVAMSLGLTGCEDYGDDGNRDHNPPAGMGSLVIDNNTVDDIHVYVDGVQLADVGDYSDRAYDLEPGKHRLILDQSGGDRNYRNDIDIIEGRLTVADVTVDGFDPLSYDVVIFFD